MARRLHQQDYLWGLPVKEISRSYPGLNDSHPYIPSWLYKDDKPPMCSCGHHEGYHDSDGECSQRYKCKCNKYDGQEPVMK